MDDLIHYYEQLAPRCYLCNEFTTNTLKTVWILNQDSKNNLVSFQRLHASVIRARGGTVVLITCLVLTSRPWWCHQVMVESNRMAGKAPASFVLIYLFTLLCHRTGHGLVAWRVYNHKNNKVARWDCILFVFLFSEVWSKYLVKSIFFILLLFSKYLN